MTGLFLLGVIALWVGIVVKLSRWTGGIVCGGRWRGPIALVVFLSLLLLPVLDEIIGGFQFRELCKTNASEYRLGVANLEGRTARVTINPSNENLRGTAIPIRHSRVFYHDVSTGELMVEFDTYVARGGRLIEALGISESGSPLTIGSPSCSPERRRAENARLTFKFKVIN